MKKLLTKDNLTTAGYLIGGGIVAYFVIKNFNKIKQKIALQQQLNLYAQAQQGYNVTTPTGQTVTVTVNLAQVSQEINATEDKEAAIAAIKKVPKQLIPALTQTYLQLFNRDLRADFVKYLSTDEFEQVAYLFN
jgi:ribosome-associated translation inhibitor RaiA